MGYSWSTRRSNPNSRRDLTEPRTDSGVEVVRVEFEHERSSVRTATRCECLQSADPGRYSPGALGIGHCMEDVPDLSAVRREEVCIVPSAILAVVAGEHRSISLL
jgi:hypothetical protein